MQVVFFQIHKKNVVIVTLTALGVVGSAAAICVAAGLGGVTLNVRN